MQEGQRSCRSLDHMKRVIHAMQLCDPASKFHFFTWFLQSGIEGKIELQLAFFSDEVWCHLQGYSHTETMSNP
jgi:hypothetical protein